jgi:hypothetical protein
MKKRIMLCIICLMTIMAIRPFNQMQVLGQTPVPPDEKQKILDNLNKLLNQVQTQTAAITALKPKGANAAEKAAIDDAASKASAISTAINGAISAVNVGLEALNDSLVLVQNAVADLIKTVNASIAAGILITQEVVQGIYDITVTIVEGVETIVKGLIKLIGTLIIELISLPFTIIKGLWHTIFGSKNDTSKLTVPITPTQSGLPVDIRYAFNDTLVATGVTDDNGTFSIYLPLETYYAGCVFGTSDVVFLGSDRTVPINGATVGGIVVPVDKFGLSAPYIGLTATILAALVASTVYVKRVKRREEKQ